MKKRRTMSVSLQFERAALRFYHNVVKGKRSN
jgi:hypothetical protein